MEEGIEASKEFLLDKKNDNFVILDSEIIKEEEELEKCSKELIEYDMTLSKLGILKKNGPIKEESAISNIFFGKFKEIISYKNQEGIMVIMNISLNNLFVKFKERKI